MALMNTKNKEVNHIKGDRKGSVASGKVSHHSHLHTFGSEMNTNESEGKT